jgi:hypothetical protein
MEFHLEELKTGAYWTDTNQKKKNYAKLFVWIPQKPVLIKINWVGLDGQTTEVTTPLCF